MQTRNYYQTVFRCAHFTGGSYRSGVAATIWRKFVCGNYVAKCLHSDDPDDWPADSHGNRRGEDNDIRPVFSAEEVRESHYRVPTSVSAANRYLTDIGKGGKRIGIKQ